MSRSTTIAITREAYISTIIKSFSTHFIILFSKFRDSLDVVHIIYYSPIDIDYKIVTKNLRIISICLQRVKMSIIWQFVRLYSPVLDSNVLSKYLSLNTKTKTFIQILRYLLLHYPSNPVVNRKSKGGESSNNNNLITGITITLRGRIQTESIKPRKTVQSIIAGSHDSNFNRGKHNLVSDSSSTTKSNYELGSYSISVKVTGIV